MTAIFTRLSIYIYILSVPQFSVLPIIFSTFCHGQLKSNLVLLDTESATFCLHLLLRRGLTGFPASQDSYDISGLDINHTIWADTGRATLKSCLPKSHRRWNPLRS